MPEYMDAIGSLRKVARELAALETLNLESHQLFGQINGAAFLINWIADGLQNELNLAAQRANELKYKQIGMGTIDYT